MLQPHGKIPRNSTAQAIFLIAILYADSRKVILSFFDVCHTSAKLFSIIFFKFSFTSSISQKKDCIPCTHSKYDTTTPPLLARISGII